MRDAKWERDEIILALDLYFEMDGGNPPKAKLIELSEIINSLPLFKSDQKSSKFRNPDGVGMKLSNFISLDDNHPGKGLIRGSTLDREVFDEFKNDKFNLRKIAFEIKAIAANFKLSDSVSRIEDTELGDYVGVKEGQILFKMHKSRERDKKINQKKKDKILKETGVLKCEACDFDFYEKYGEIGKGFIECHHLVPLSNFTTNKITFLEDLALLCSNCHRMIHKDLKTSSIKEFKIKWIINSGIKVQKK